MNTLVSVVGEVEAAVAGGDPTRRVETLRRVTDLFLARAPSLTEGHVTAFDEVILRLSRDLEFRARVELSERLADCGQAPRRVTRQLATDEAIEVAGPVLERSARLDEDTLVEIARARGQAHLMALSRRSILSERVTDVLVDRGDGPVVRSVAGNSGARFSEHGLAQVVERGRDDPALRAVLTRRADLPPQHMARLVEIAQERVRETLRAEFGGLEGEVVEAAIDDAAILAAASGTGTLTDDFAAAKAVVARRAAGGDLAERDVMDWLKAGQVAEALAGIASLANLPVEAVARAYHAPHYDPLLFIVRSVKFGWGSFKLLLAAKVGREPPPDMRKSAFDSFQQLSVQTAQRVVRFTAARERMTGSDAA